MRNKYKKQHIEEIANLIERRTGIRPSPDEAATQAALLVDYGRTLLAWDRSDNRKSADDAPEKSNDAPSLGMFAFALCSGQSSDPLHPVN